MSCVPAPRLADGRHGITSPLRGGRNPCERSVLGFREGGCASTLLPPSRNLPSAFRVLANFDLPSRGRLRALRHANAGSLPVQRRRWHAAPLLFGRRWPLATNEDAAELLEVRAIAAGDSAAFQRLIDREAPRLLRFALGLLGNLDDAEDVVQDTMIRLWENAASWTPDARIGTWLHRVSYNRAIDLLRRRRAFVDESALVEIVDNSELPDAAMVRSEAVLSLKDAIEKLPTRQRTAVLLFHFQEFSQREAANVMGVSEDALESMLARARRQLRRRLEGEGDGNE